MKNINPQIINSKFISNQKSIQSIQTQTLQNQKTLSHILDSDLIISKIKNNPKKKPSLINQIKSYIYLPMILLLCYFTAQMLILSSIQLAFDIYLSFKHFFTRLKQIFQQNTIFLLFWAVIIIKTKIPQLQRLFYHTIVRSILQNQDTQCSICLNEQCDYIMPKCQHNYHSTCVQKWLKAQACCPYCRTKTQNKIVRNVPWKLFLKSILKNKIKWLLILVACVFIQYRFTGHQFFQLSFKQKE